MYLEHVDGIGITTCLGRANQCIMMGAIDG
jgi:hypothetical protein